MGRRAALIAAFLLLGFMGRGAGADDPDLAKYLVKGAKDDIGKKQFDAALVKLKRAVQEDSTLLEAVYLQGVVGEARNDPAGAVTAYRAYVAGVHAKAAAGALTKDETALEAKSQARIEALAAGSVELDRLENSFTDRLLTFAKSNFVKDPTIAGKALRVLLELSPDHEEAGKLLAKLGEAAPSAAPPAPVQAAGAPASPFRTVKTWKDLIGTHFFGKNEGWTYDGDHLRLEREGGSLTQPADKSPTGEKYAIEMEVKIVEVHGDRPLIGVAFGKQDNDFYSFFLTEKESILIRVVNGENADISRVDLPTALEGGWYRLGGVVRGNRMEGWVNGALKSEHTASERTDLKGELAIFQQNCKAEVRLLRVGDLP